ncbi:hypothetical protein [Hoeflea poritis]|uniref:Alpha-1,2-fucosyltransferase n=1 Tax=Hoeflea poritis TaxID=2993659 RepID=A0ABT4VQ98_9HYPH|nr:hypothetical protein [Hoeflea poritis]MDA4846345.1 hypothetical protein [Hoeflea poritis]
MPASDPADAQGQYGLLFYEFVCLVQKYAERTNPVHPCFAPIGTNMLMLASEISINVRLRRRTVIVEGAYEFDRKYIADFNREQGTKHSVLPWVLQRFDDHHDDPNPWTIWFRDLCDNDRECPDYQTRLDELETRMAALRPRVTEPHLIEIGICTDYVSRLNTDTLARIEPHRMTPEKGAVAVHIRRGDASDETMENADPNRQTFPLERYIEAMEEYSRKGFDHFYILTESQQEIDRIEAHFGGRCRISWQIVDRAKFPNLHGKKHERANFIEYQCLDNPDLISFSMHTALVDLDNASRCEAFIGSFESAFSNLAFLKAVGHHKRHTEYLDLAGTTFGKPLFYPNLAESRGTSLFVIKERDVGFFSLFLQIVNTLLYLREHEPDAVPVVQFTDKQEYFTGSETWEDFFEPLVFLSRSAVAPLLRRVQRNFRLHFPEMKYWDPLGVVYSPRPNLNWSGSYYPNLRLNRVLSRLPLKPYLKFVRSIDRIRKSNSGGRQRKAGNVSSEIKTDLLVSHKTIPSLSERRRASKVIGNYVNLKPEIQQSLAELFDKYSGYHIIGVQFRGTDARKDSRRKIPAYEDYVDAIKHYIDGLSVDIHRRVFIFVASDESEFVSFLSGKFENVGHFDAIRHVGDDETAKSDGKTGWSMPAFVRIDRKNALRGAILDYAGLCRCDFMIHNFGSLTNAVLLTRPDIGNLLIGYDYVQVEDNGGNAG